MANFGYQVHNCYWGKGYGREAAKAALKIGFSQLCLNRLEAAIDRENPRSLALARAIGMRREGVKRNYLYEDGAWTDQIVFVANPADAGLRAAKPLE
jgi:RimJ/RimL family protein N-acetyltransferase